MAALNLSQIARPVAAKPAVAVAGLSPVAAPVKLAKKTVSNVTARSMQVWHPRDNKYFETLSYLPPLTQEQIAKQVDYIVGNGWTPSLEFSDVEFAYVASTHTTRFHDNGSVNYYDNRYWTMWKLPMFGCTDASQVLGEVQACTKAFPDAYIRLVAFDAVRQVQITGFLVHRPDSAKDFRAPDQRSIA